MNTQESTIKQQALEMLRTALGDENAEFRPGQMEAILELALNRKRLLLVQRTGWGKSMVYFISAALLNREKGGLAFVVSPLLSLMRDQIRAANRLPHAIYLGSMKNVCLPIFILTLKYC